MTIYDLMMQDEKIKKSVLIEFGFGEISPKKVEAWFKKLNPDTYAQFKQQCKNSNVLGFNPKSVEATTRAERDAILDNFMNQVNAERNIVKVYEDELQQLIDQKDEYFNDAMQFNNLLYDFIYENGLQIIFEKWLLEKKDWQETEDEYDVTREMYGDIDQRLYDFIYQFREEKISQ